MRALPKAHLFLPLPLRHLPWDAQKPGPLEPHFQTLITWDPRYGLGGVGRRLLPPHTHTHTAGSRITSHPPAFPLPQRRGHQHRGLRRLPGHQERSVALSVTGKGGGDLTRLDVAATLPTLAQLWGAYPAPASLSALSLQSWPGASRGAPRLPATGLRLAPRAMAGADSELLALRTLAGGSEL